jgi:membrane protein
MVLWVYYSAQIFRFGAEFTWLFATNFGSGPKSNKPLQTSQGGKMLENIRMLDR